MSLGMLNDYRKAGRRRAWATARYLMADAIERKLPQVRAPTLVIRGERDPMVSQRWAEEVTRLLPEARLVVIPGAAHTVVRFAPHECAAAVRRFPLRHRASEAGQAA
jgi:2-hydroxy-6-oxonona-2,4-dienedioate hydrolase